jgi:hypothetical protein
MSRAGWQVVRKVSVVLTCILILDWLVLIGGTVFLAITTDRGAVARFLLSHSESADGAESFWTPTHFVLEMILMALFTVGAWLLSQHAQRHLQSNGKLPAVQSET